MEKIKYVTIYKEDSEKDELLNQLREDLPKTINEFYLIISVLFTYGKIDAIVKLHNDVPITFRILLQLYVLYIYFNLVSTTDESMEIMVELFLEKMEKDKAFLHYKDLDYKYQTNLFCIDSMILIDVIARFPKIPDKFRNNTFNLQVMEKSEKVTKASKKLFNSQLTLLHSICFSCYYKNPTAPIKNIYTSLKNLLNIKESLTPKQRHCRTVIFAYIQMYLDIYILSSYDFLLPENEKLYDQNKIVIEKKVAEFKNLAEYMKQVEKSFEQRLEKLFYKKVPFKENKYYKKYTKK